MTDTQRRLRRLLSMAFPMLVSQASETIMLFVDRLFLSRLGPLQLSAAMTGGLTNFVVCSFFIGTVSYVNAIVAQYYGADRIERCARATAQGVFISLAAYPLLLAIIPFVPFVFQAAGHGPEQIALESVYSQTLLYGSVFLILRNAMAGFFLGIGRTRVVMVSNIIGMCVNVPLNYLLIFGALGFPQLGMRGAAIGTICGSATTFAILLASYLSRRFHERYDTRGRWALDWGIIRRLIRFGVPAGTEMFLNVAAFNIFVQLMHSYGTTVAAAVTIAFNYDILAFIPMLGMGVAVTALVGQHMGAGDSTGAHKTTILALKVAYIYAGTMVLLFVLATRPLVSLFASGFAEADPGVSDLAVVMLRLAAIYILADSTQLVFAGALRGAGDTAWVMWISVALHWVLAVSAYVLTRVLVVPPVSVWVFFICFVLTLGVSMYLRYRTGAWKLIQVIESD